MKIIIPIINTWIWDFIMALPLLKNIEKNKNLEPILLFNKQVYKDIFDFSFLNKDRFEVILEDNISNFKFWLKLRKQAKIIISPTVWFKPLILWKSLFFKVYSKPLILGNKFWNVWIKSFWIPQNHDVINNINILERFYKDYKNIKQQIKIYEPKLIIENNNKEKIIFIHPWFDWNSILPKDWWIENWISLVEQLANLKKDYKIKIIIWPWFEENFKEEYFKLSEKYKNIEVIYKIDLKQLVKELAKWEILINTDSWIGHLAWALWLKTITLFWPVDETQSKVFSKKAITIRDNQTKPCYSQGIWIKKCNNLNWLKNITIDTILKYV